MARRAALTCTRWRSCRPSCQVALGRGEITDRPVNYSGRSNRTWGTCMDLGLNGKRALVTGATKGIGRAIAETLLAEGASVAICARTADDVDQAVKELSANGHGGRRGRRRRRHGQPPAWVSSSAEQLGGIDLYVHNTSGKPARKLEDWSNNFQIDLMALVHGVDAATEALADGGGSVISIGTTATAEHFASGSNSYSAFKAAVTNWTLGQAQTLGAKGIRCNVVSPGPIFIEGGDWDMVKTHMAAFYEATEKGHPVGRSAARRTSPTRSPSSPASVLGTSTASTSPSTAASSSAWTTDMAARPSSHERGRGRRRARHRRQVARHRLRPARAARPAGRARADPGARPTRLRGHRGDRADSSILVSYTCDVRPSEAAQRAIRDWVEGGGRWVALHGTNAALDNVDGRAGPVESPRVLPAVGRHARQPVHRPPTDPAVPGRAERPAHWLVGGSSRSNRRRAVPHRVPRPRRAAAAAAHDVQGEAKGFVESRLDGHRPRPTS